jgi:hypothetical protein
MRALSFEVNAGQTALFIIAHGPRKFTIAAEELISTQQNEAGILTILSSTCAFTFVPSGSEDICWITNLKTATDGLKKNESSNKIFGKSAALSTPSIAKREATIVRHVEASTRPAKHIFPVGDVVTLTPEGALAHRKYHANKNKLIGAGVGMLVLPAIIPSAGVGLAAGGFAVGISEPVQSAIGGLIGGMAGALFGQEPEGGTRGRILAIESRFQGGVNVQVQWSIHQEDGQVTQKSSWHQGKHLQRLT